jgi:hypothetical protein
LAAFEVITEERARKNCWEWASFALILMTGCASGRGASQTIGGLKFSMRVIACFRQ